MSTFKNKIYIYVSSHPLTQSLQIHIGLLNKYLFKITIKLVVFKYSLTYRNKFNITNVLVCNLMVNIYKIISILIQFFNRAEHLQSTGINIVLYCILIKKYHLESTI